jgi:HSP20 family protein
MNLVGWQPLRWEPFGGLEKIQSRINELFDETFGRPRSPAAASMGAWYPPVDILESKDGYLIRAELPGMKKDDFHVEYREGNLSLSGEKKFEEPANGVEYQRVERTAGKFSRSFYLPQSVKHAEITATYRDGILEVTVPKAEEAKPKQIEVTTH